MPLLYWLKLKLADVLVYRHWRNMLGGKVEGVIIGAAPLQARLGKLFSAAGIEIREGYGLTETSPVISSNRFEPGGVRFGTVGIPIPGMDIKIEKIGEAGDGEILVKGPNVMLGYYNNEEETKKVMTPDGWFRTGDVGKMVHKRFLTITGRKKDIFKTSSGKYIAPQELENLLKASPFIENCMITGYKQPFVAALILPCFPLLKKWCEDNNVHWTAPQFMILNPKVVKFMEEEVKAVNANLPNHKKIRKIQLLYRDWSVDSGELTPTLKLKRDVIMQNNVKLIDEMFRT